MRYRVSARWEGRVNTLYIAASNENIVAVQLLLEKGAGKQARQSEGILKLCGHCASIDSRSGGVINALHFAVRRNYIELVQSLLGKGTGVDATGEGGSTALHLTATRGYLGEYSTTTGERPTLMP